MAPTVFPDKRTTAKRRILESRFWKLLAQYQQDGIPLVVQPSGHAVPEREHTSSTSTRGIY
ncbi:hypothetical protein I3843_10G122600 [Carya illinoinensis]|nr:hypothetical protein I3843_10G122600 [Carya illinoinensis]